MPDQPRIGVDFAGYRLESFAGRGGAGSVYRATNIEMGNEVALKVLAPEFALDDAYRERFVREAQAALAINHPNIIPIYKYGSDGDYLYIAMRFVEGSDLKEILARDGALDTERTYRLVKQIARGLDAAHRKGLIHRDVKPANVLIQDAGEEDEHVYIVDFGLTKRDGKPTGVTDASNMLGTIDYMAPEQIEGQDVDQRVDVYALACLLYQCLTGSVPFPKDTDVAVLWAQMNAPPPKVSERRQDVPIEVDAVIERGMSKARADRFETCGELVAAFGRALHGGRGITESGVAIAGVSAAAEEVSPPPRTEETVVAPSELAAAAAVDQPAPASSGPPSGGGGSNDWMKRRSTLLAGAAVLVVLVLGGLAAGGVFSGDDSSSDASGMSDTSSSSDDMGMSGSSGSSNTTTSSSTGGSTDFKTVVNTMLAGDMTGCMTMDAGVVSCTKPAPQGPAQSKAKAMSVTFTPVDTAELLHGAFVSEYSAVSDPDFDKSSSNTGTCEWGRKASNQHWDHVDNWWHHYPGMPVDKSETQDGRNLMMAQDNPPDGQVLCYTDEDGMAVVVWTESYPSMSASPTDRFVGKIVAEDNYNASVYWHALHHNLM